MTHNHRLDGPRLVFDRAELPALRDRVLRRPLSAVWAAVRERAHGLHDPNHPWYLAPGDVDAESRSHSKLHPAHLFGKRMMVAAELEGFTFQMTGDRRCAQHAVDVTLAAAERFPVTDPRMATPLVGGWGITCRGFATALDWLGQTMAAGQSSRIAETGAGYVEAILELARNENTWWVPYHNFMGVALGGAGLLSLKLEELGFSGAREWRDACAAGIARWLDTGFDAKGAYFEGVLYAHFGLENSMFFADALKRSGGPDLFDHPHLRQLPHFLAMSLLPGETAFDARNDSHYRGLHFPFMLRLARAHHNGLARWLWDRCGSGSSPLRIVWSTELRPEPPGHCEPLAEHFEGRGLCVFRTGWQPEDAMLSIEAGPYYKITHNQADKGHITLYALRRRWAIDSGYGNNNRDPNSPDQTLAHNCVLIDGQGQALSGAGLGTNGRIAAYAHGETHDYAMADATEAYNRNNRGAPGAGVAHAFRHVLFARPSHGAPAYAVLLDDISKDDAPHEYTWLLHTELGNTVQLLADGAVITPGPPARSLTSADTGLVADEWRLDVEQEGDYALWACLRTAGALVADLFPSKLQIDDGAPLVWRAPEERRYAWRRVAPENHCQTWHLSPGSHTVRIETFDRTVQVARLKARLHSAGVEPPLEEAEGIAAQQLRPQPERDPGKGARMLVRLDGAAPVDLELAAYDEHPVLRARVRTVRLDLAALLIPIPAGVRDPDIAFTREAQGMRIDIRWQRRNDEIFWPAAPPRTPRFAVQCV